MLSEKLLGNSIQLCGDLPEILIQIQGACTDLVAAQVEETIRRDGFLRFGVDQQPGNVSSMGSVLIFNVGVDLVEVSRMQGLFIELLLHGLAVIFSIQNENFFVETQKNIGLHGGEKPQHGGVVFPHKIPFDLCGFDFGKIGVVLSVIFQNKALVQLCHAFVRKGCHFVAAGFGSLQHIV